MRLLEELFTMAFASMFLSVIPLFAFAAWDTIREKYKNDPAKKHRYEGLLLYGCGVLIYITYFGR